jgi:hypothetical protein
MQPLRTSIWLHDSIEPASGKPGTLQSFVVDLCLEYADQHIHPGTNAFEADRMTEFRATME